MNREFIETATFMKNWKNLGLGDQDLKDLQEVIMSDPQAGDMIVKTGGARKMRIALPGRGKSGSARVIYVDFLVQEIVILITCYPKNKQESLTDEQKNDLKKLITAIKKQIAEGE